jgi:hypothetical protein
MVLLCYARPPCYPLHAHTACHGASSVVGAYESGDRKSEQFMKAETKKGLFETAIGMLQT